MELIQRLTIQKANQKSDHNNVLCSVLGPSKKPPKSPVFREYEYHFYCSWQSAIVSF